MLISFFFVMCLHMTAPSLACQEVSFSTHICNQNNKSQQQPRVCRVRNCAFLVANMTKNFALATRISQLVASGRLTTLFHATVITQTVALIFSQIDQYKIQSRSPIGYFHFTFLLLWKYKTVFLLLSIYHNVLLPCFFSISALV